MIQSWGTVGLVLGGCEFDAPLMIAHVTLDLVKVFECSALLMLVRR